MKRAPAEPTSNRAIWHPDHVVPVIRSRKEHGISRRNIDPDALSVLYRLDRAGYAAYLVGGGVRDLMLGRQPKDFDVGTDAHPKHIKQLFPNAFIIGRRFKLVHVRFGNKVIETSTFRRTPDSAGDMEDPDAEIFHQRDNTFGTPEEDAFRRDFTINGLFYDIKNFSLIDYVGGLADLDKKLIRSIGPAEIRFREDSVRMLRAIRFAARLDFTLEPATYQAILKHHAEIAKASSARLLEDVYRLFPNGTAEKAFRLLRQTHMLGDIFPDLGEFLSRHHHHDGLFWRMLNALDAAEDTPEPCFIFASLYWTMFKDRMSEEKRLGVDFSHVGSAEELLQPIARRFQVPKRVYYDTCHILADQHTLDAGARSEAGMKRLVFRPSFPHSMRFLQLRVAAGDAADETVAKWAAYHASVGGARATARGEDAEGQDGEASAEEDGGHKKRRRRSGRRRR